MFVIIFLNLKMLGLYLDTLIIGHTFCSMLRNQGRATHSQQRRIYVIIYDGRRIPLIYFLILEIKIREEMKDVEYIMASTDVVFQADLTSKSEVEKDGRKWRKV